MIKRLLNLNTIQKITLILTTLILLPMSSWAISFFTDGNITGSNNSYTWTYSGSKSWTITTNSATLDMTNSTNLSATITSSGNITLSTTRPVDNNCKLSGIRLSAQPNTPFENCSIILKFQGSNDQYTLNIDNDFGDMFYNFETPIEWAEGKSIEVIISQANSGSSASCNISMITIYAQELSDAHFEWPAKPTSEDDINGIQRTEPNGVLLEGHCMKNTVFSFPLQETTGTSVKITYESSNTAVATVDETGKVTVKGAGLTTITATPEDPQNTQNWYFEPASHSYTLNITGLDEDYGLTVGGIAVTSSNKNSITGAGITSGQVSYNPENHTLSLNGVTTSMIYCQAPQPLTIEINGSNTVGMIVGYGGDENPLTIKKSGSSPASLDINPGDQVLDDMGPVFHFSSCTWGDGLYLVAYSNNTTISGAYYDESGRQFKHSTYSSINRVIISTPSIWVGGAKVLEDGTFSNNSGILFDKETNTLTLSSSPSGNITSSLQNLKINIDGNDLCMYTNKIISVNSTASLSFEGSSNKSSLSFAIDNARTNNILPWEGFTGNPTFEDKLVYLPNDGSQFIKVLEAPTILYSEGSLKFSGLSDTYGNYFNCHYTITYGDGTTETGQNSEMGESLSVSKPQLTPCTVTAYAEFDQFGQTTRSDNAIAYYLEFAEDMKVTFDGTEREIQKSDYPALIPDVEDIEFILSNSTNTNAICQETIGNESHIKIKGFGATDLILYNSKVLNNGGGSVALSATVVPSVPTFSIEPGTYNEAQTLTLASPYQKTNGDDQTVINIKYYTDGNSNNPFTYTGPISINQSTTITAWVEASVTLPTGAQETYSSDEISQEYVIKEEAFIDFMQEENDEYSPIGANQVITGTYGHTIPKVVMPYVSDLQGTITFSSSDETVVASSSISLDEEYTLKYTVSGAGNTTIQAKYTPGADEPFLSTTRNFNLKIEPRDISNATISMGTNGESSFVYNGAAIEPITSVSLAASGTAIAATLNAETDFDSNYYLVSGETETALDGAPTNVGSYKVTVSAKGNYTGSKSATFTIIQTTITPTVEITGWTYGATANTPSVSGNTGNGSVTYEYKLQNAEDSKYSTEVPTEAGNYTIKATIAATVNYEAAVDSTHFTISKANITPTVALEGWAYGATANTPSVSGNTGEGSVTYEYKLKTAEDSEYKADVPTEAGDYTIKATIAATANFEGATTTTDFTITKTSITPTVTLEGWTYGTTAKTPTISGNTGNGSVTYEYKLKTAEDSEYKADAPTEAGDYTIKATIAATANYEAATATTDFTISKANITPTVTLEGWTYGATANTPTITGNTGNGTVTYTYKAEGAETFVETAPETAGNYTIKASIAETANYNAGEATAEFTITAATMSVTAAGYKGTYDTQAHGITVTAPDGATVQYMNQEGTYTLTEAPTYTDAGTYEVHYQVTKDNYTTVTSSATVEISKADITPTVTLEGWTYGTTAKTPSITGNSGNGAVTYTYKAEGADAFGETAPEVVGAHTIKASIAETTNYNAGEATATFTITAATMNVTVEGYEGTYDTQAHGIKVTAPEDATVKYGSQEGTYNLQNSPTYTDAGTYNVYYQVTMPNYTTVTGSKTVEISKANITPTVALEGWTYGTTANTPNITGNTGNGNVTYTYKTEGSETFVDTKPEVVGTHTIKALIAETTNYNAGEATAEFTITAATSSVTAKGYKGAYNNEAHGITITAPEGSTVMYGTQEGTYEQSESPTYTNAGNYTVYYQVTKENYTTVTGSVTIEISKADITPSVTLEGWTYGTTAKTPSITGNTGEGTVTYTYRAEGADAFGETAPEVVGTHTVKASIAETTNYNAGEATATFTITAATMTVTAAGHEGTYDNKAHGITVTAPEGSKVMYGSQNGTYNLTEAPTYTDAGTYEVYYQVTMDNYTTVTGSETVKINKVAITPTVTLEGWTYGTTAKSPSVTGNTGEGAITYTYKAEGAETFVETIPVVVGTHTVKASIAETTNYNAGEATTTFTITAATMTITAAGHEGTYDGKAHGITVTAPEDATIKYGEQEGTYNLTEAPTYTDAGNYTVYYQVTMNNYNTVTGSETVAISKANIIPTVSLEGWTYGTTAKSPSVTGNTGEGTVTYTYKAEGAETFVETKPEVVGTHTIKASIAETTNYNAGEATTTFTITAATMNVTAEGHSGTYDGKAHGITVSAPEDATVMYGTQEGKYDLTESPTYTDADTYIVYYQVTMDNYNTFTGSATVDISKADITPTVSLEGWTYGTTAKSPSVTGNTGEGTVTYTYQAEGAEIFTETMPEVVGTHTIKASIAETTNYNAGEATATFTITAATMTVTAKGYEGTYDGKAHGITVSAPEDATIKYGETDGTYELSTSPEYTTAGNYTVYYQVTMDNYATVTGSETVKISKAEAELEFDVPEESKVYATIGKEFTEPTLNNLKGLDVTFSSSDESVATVDKTTGKVTLKSAGLTYITATFAGNDNYNEFAVKYELRVKGTYNLWIDNVQVTSDNYNDILENQKFFYDLVNKWLIITNNETPVTVKSSMPELTIYLNGKSELERIYFDNQGNAQNTGTLSFFNYNDVPGKLTLDTNNDNGVISGFSSISFDDNTKLRFIDPDSCEYKDGLVKMTKPSQLGEIVKQVTIGQYIEPMANGDGISFGNIDSETNITNMTIEDKLLITATQHEEGSNEDDDYIDPNNGAFVMNTTNTSEDVEVLSQGVESGNKQPGSEDYADSFRGGITFMIPSGTGTIELELMNEEGYMLMLKIGTGDPHEIVRYERATVVIDYNVDEPTYVYLYLEEKSIIGARRAGNNTRVGKRDKAHGTVFSVKVKAASVSSTNPLNNVEGATGTITIPDVNTTTPSGDDVPTKAEFNITNDENKVNDDKWYTIDGQRINKPTQKGLYIRNRKKVVVK